MPLYDFICRDCDNRFDDLVRTPLDEVACPDCRGADVVRVYSPFAVHGGTKNDGAAGCGAGACMPGPAGATRSGGCCGGGCGGCG